MKSIMTLTDTILDHIPKPAAGWAVYRQTAPKPTEKPPWVIETVTTADSVNVLADDLMIPRLAGKRFIAQGFDTGCLTLFSDSGAYAAGLTAEDTALLYQCRLLTFKFNWSRM